MLISLIKHYMLATSMIKYGTKNRLSSFFSSLMYCTTKRVLPLSKWPGEEEEEERRSLVRCHGIVVIEGGEGGEGYDLMLRYDRMNSFTYFLPGRIYSKEKGENTEEFHVQK